MIKKLQFFIYLLLYILLINIIAFGNVNNDIKYFDIQIMQDNQIYQIRNNEVSIYKKPFTLIIIMKSPIGVLTNFSLDPKIYNGLLEKKTVMEILDDPNEFMGMAEYNFNPDEEIIIDKVVPHYLFYDNDENHRFSEIIKKDNKIYCYRKISNYSFRHTINTSTSISKLPDDTLYINLVYSEWNDDYTRNILESNCLKINFIH